MRSGDSTSNWEFVQMNIPLILGIGLSAQPVSGCDIGGFCAAWQVGFRYERGRDLSIMITISNPDFVRQYRLVKAGFH